MITVEEVWRGALPAGTELIAGAAGLRARVEWAAALRSRPPAFEAIKGGELAFIPVASLRLLDERLTLAGVMASLADKGGAAVAVLGDIPQDGVELADRLQMPLLQLPASSQIVEAHAAAVRFILDQRTLLHERQQALHSELTELALAGSGPEAIVERLATVTGGTAAWFDAEGALRHAYALGESPPSLGEDRLGVLRWADTIPLLATDPPVRETAAAGGPHQWVAPIPLRDGVGGFVLVEGDNLDPQLARVAVSRAAAACAIDLHRERAVLRAREDMEGGVLESLLSGTYVSEEWVRERLGRLGARIGDSATVYCLRVDGDAVGRDRETLLRAVRSWASLRDPDALVASRVGDVVLLTAFDDDAARNRGAAQLHDNVAVALKPRTVSLGIGRPKAGLTGVRASYREAQGALQLAARLLGPGRVIDFAALGLHRLLLALVGQPELEEFYREAVGKLVDYDTRTHSGLMQTMEAFFACHGSPTDMAQYLKLHRNTVLYRLRRIAEVGQLNLDDPDARLALHLCLRIRDVMSAQETRRAS